jgi:hypothetical protein
MPDHLDVLVTATSEPSDFCETVRRFKQVSAADLKVPHYLRQTKADLKVRTTPRT